MDKVAVRYDALPSLVRFQLYSFGGAVMKYGIIWFSLVSLCLPAFAEESAALRKTIRLRGLPNDEVPVITSLALQPNGNLLATAGDDHTVRLWNVSTGQLTRTLRGHSDWVTSVAFCNAGSMLLTGGRDRQLLMWDLDQPIQPVPLGSHSRPISSVKVHDATNRVAVVGFRAPLKIYDSSNGRLKNTFKCPCMDTRAIAFSPSGDLLAAGGRNGKLRIWNLRTGRQIDLTGHQRRVTSVVFATESLLLSAGEDRAIHSWNIAQESKQQSFSHGAGKVLAMTMIDENQFAAATTTNEIAVFHMHDSLPFAVLKGHTGSVAALVAREHQLISGSFDTTIRVWDVVDHDSDNQATNQPSKPADEAIRATSVSKRLASPPTIIE